ncbi:PREDICTED: LOW QUALITY PROTEIN [Prunus dulcis]|uniref:PREDICTED: LOW QUALITY PROTEIN n=1 Tax=Prunus dulcis TaxID=3755 RepID=A0A5E4G2E9_PRUDU|nr:uncharacterized protein LOC117630271 [Prunus dulcis]VVA33884.1 PREDICTED: LOW QUALITY PROTEIN [Prunus dulcis]
MMMTDMYKAVVPGQVRLTRTRIVSDDPNKGCLRNRNLNLVNVVGKGKLGGNISPLQPMSIPIQRRRRLMASYNNNNIWHCIPSSSYGDPCLDLFFDALRPEYRDVNPCLKYLEQLLPLAWSHDPLTTLKLIFTFHSLYFSERKFDTALLWLLHNHPKTLLRNLHSIADFPFFDCPGRESWSLVQILYNVLVQKPDGQVHDAATHPHLHPERYHRDPDYRLLHDRVIHIFVERLKSDIDKMEQSDYISDAAACCTSTLLWDKHRTSTIFLCDSIARRLSLPGSDQLEEEFLVPLTNYDNKKIKKQNLEEEYLHKVKAAADLGGGIGIIKPDALLPHQFIGYVGDKEKEGFGEVIELQWKAMVDLYQKQGEDLSKFKNMLVVPQCRLKYHLEIGLGLLVSELSEEPWKGKLIGGGGEPFFIRGDNDLKSKCELWWKSDKSSVLGVIDLILEVGVNMNLKAGQMIKKVIVFTELESRELQYQLLRSEYEAIQSKYKDKGYGNDAVPHILYWDWDWDFQTSSDSWICTQHPGFTMLKGSSDNLVKSFCHNAGEIGPLHLMEATIAGKEYQTFTVVD